MILRLRVGMVPRSCTSLLIDGKPDKAASSKFATFVSGVGARISRLRRQAAHLRKVNSLLRDDLEIGEWVPEIDLHSGAGGIYRALANAFRQTRSHHSTLSVWSNDP